MRVFMEDLKTFASDCKWTQPRTKRLLGRALNVNRDEQWMLDVVRHLAEDGNCPSTVAVMHRRPHDAPRH